MVCVASLFGAFFRGVSFHNQTFNQILGQVVPWREALKLIVPQFDILLLALQNGAHRIGVYRDFQPNPIHV